MLERAVLARLCQLNDSSRRMEQDGDGEVFTVYAYRNTIHPSDYTLYEGIQ